MKKICAFIGKYRPTRRRILQLYFALLFNCNFKGFLSGKIYSDPKGSKGFCVPGLNCYSCPGAIGACPLGSLQNALDDSHSTLFYIGGILLLYSILFGRIICGWLCPFGLLQDLLHKIPTPKLKKGPLTRLLSLVKYVLLAVFVVIVPVLYIFRNTPTPAFCKFICPAGTLEGGMLLLQNKVNSSFFSMLGPLFTFKFLLMVSILTGCIFLYRLFCRFLCPLGAIYGLFNRISFFGVEVEEEKCIHCNRCLHTCQVDIRHVGDRECISCGDCISDCPTKAISWKQSKLLKPTRNSKSGLRIVAAVMIAVLIATSAWIWITTPTLEEQQLTSGCAVGNRLPGKFLPIITKDAVTANTFDPTTTGKVTVINFWGTWCASCIEELPAFHKIALDYADSACVVAIHTDALVETAPDYIEEHYPASPMIFLADNAAAEYYTLLGGLGNYPHTVIIDENGIVLEIFTKPVLYSDLQRVIDAALN